MREQTHLTEAEWKIIRVLWDANPRTLMEVTRALEAETGWTKHTVLTLLKRMLAKGTVRLDVRGGAKAYVPAVEKDKVAGEQARTLLSRLFSGRAALLVNTLVEQGEVSQGEIEEMLDILRKASKAGRE